MDLKDMTDLIRAYDAYKRLDQDYVLPMLEKAGETYAKTLESGFDMYY